MLRTYRIVELKTNTIHGEFSIAEMDPPPVSDRYAQFDITDLTPAQLAGFYHGRRVLSNLEFMRLLTQPERITIRTAAKTSGEIDDLLALLNAANGADLDDQELVYGVHALEQFGLIGAGRAVEILNG